MNDIINSFDIAEILTLEPGIIDEPELQKAKTLALENNLSLFDILVNKTTVTESTLHHILSKHYGLKQVDLRMHKPDKDLLNLIPAELAVQRCLIPLEIHGSIMEVAVSDPTDYRLYDELKLLLYSKQRDNSWELIFCLAPKDDIAEAVKEAYGLGADTIEKIVADNSASEIYSEGSGEEEIDSTILVDKEPSIIQFVNLLITDAIKNKATDIHVEPFEKKIRIRQRVDGMLQEIPIPVSLVSYTSNVISRIKIMAKLDIAEKRLPQDGRIRVKVGNDKYDLRISVLPTPYGEAVNMRILSQYMSFMSLEQLGLDVSNKIVAEDLIQRPNGVILVTGPTGSGKTTFLYACLSKINKTHHKILTIEDPIEYRMDGVIQMQTLSKIGFSFATALRSMLRHDPDVIMVGEIRDVETAQITVRSALTGHLVFSTLHTNDAAGAVARLLDMNVEPFLVASSLLSVFAIRLIRVLCPYCKKTVEVNSLKLKKLGINETDSDSMKIYEPKGCSYCHHTGFSGRTGIFEVLRITESVRDLIQSRVSTSKIKTVAIAEGMKTLRQDGWLKVKQGVTSLDEVLRVSHADELLKVSM